MSVKPMNEAENGSRHFLLSPEGERVTAYWNDSGWDVVSVFPARAQSDALGASGWAYGGRAVIQRMP